MRAGQIGNLTRIVSHYGKGAQVDVAIEECSELIKALLKERRKSSSGQETNHDILRAEIIDEIADVEIMARQLEIIYDCHNEVESRIDYKIKRQMERISAAEIKGKPQVTATDVFLFNKYRDIEKNPFMGIREIRFWAKLTERKEYDITDYNITRGKLYKIIAVKGYGGVCDFVILDDNENRLMIASDFFESPAEQGEKNDGK